MEGRLSGSIVGFLGEPTITFSTEGDSKVIGAETKLCHLDRPQTIVGVS
jgi:hypothetical protein